MKITHLNSATVIIESGSTKIVCDPWLIDGIYYGSWATTPKLNIDWSVFENTTHIYLSHIHPDHFDLRTIKEIIKYCNPKIIIYNFKEKFLLNNLIFNGFKPIEINKSQILGDIKVSLYSGDSCNPELCGKFFGCRTINSIDSLSVFQDNQHTVVNVNDCQYDLSLGSLNKILEEYKKIDLLLVSYVGAGSWPQCWNLSESELNKAKEFKKTEMLNHGIKFIKHLNPKWIMPFAGTYTLTGRLHTLNKDLPKPSLEEAQNCYSNFGECFILNSFESFEFSKPKSFVPPTTENINPLYIYDFDEDEVKNNKCLIDKSYSNFENKRKKIGFTSKTKILLYLEDELCIFNCNGDGYYFDKNKYPISKLKENFDNYIAYNLDQKLLNRILTKKAYWNNAEIGCHLSMSKTTSFYERGLHYCMNYFYDNSVYPC